MHDLPGAAAAAIIKHGTPSGAATAGSPFSAFLGAHASDPMSAFGGVLGLRGRVTLRVATEIAKNPKLDLVIAPPFQAGAPELINSTHRHAHLLTAARPPVTHVEIRPLAHGFLVQTRQAVTADDQTWSVSTRRSPSKAELDDLRVEWIIAPHAKSNAMALVKDGRLVGVGSGQVSRVDASITALRKAGDRARGAAAASDSVLTFDDAIEVLGDAGVVGLVQP